MRPILTHALVSGLVLSFTLGALLIAVFRVNAEIMLDDYPPDIKARWGPMTARTKRQRWLAAALFLLAILLVVSWSLETLPAFAAHEMTFVPTVAYFSVMFGTFNAFDWLVIDCGLVYWQPAFAVLPGTEGMAGYHDYRFHFRGFLIGILVVLAGSVLAAGAVLLLQRGPF
jgi:hypothetical protein